MRGGATSGKSFNDGCEGGVPEELEVDSRGGWIVCSADSADWSDFELLVIEGLDDSNAFSLAGLTLGAWLEGMVSGSTIRMPVLLELEGCRPCSSCETLSWVPVVDVGGDIRLSLSDREWAEELGRGSVGDDIDALFGSLRDGPPLEDGG